MKKLISSFMIVFLMLMIPNISAVEYQTEIETTDQIDQQQTSYYASISLHGGLLFAQSFKPGLEKLTRVHLIMNKVGNLYGTTIVSIRKSLTDPDLTSASFESIDMPSDLDWVEFDFPDIEVNPGDTYYIIVKPDPDSDGGEAFNFISWAFAIDNPYTNGLPLQYYQDEWGEGIPGHSSADYTFKIFATEGINQMVEISITAGNLNFDIGRGVTINALNYKDIPVIIDYSITRDRYFVNDFPTTHEANFTCPAESNWVARIGVGNEFIIYNLEISAWYGENKVERTGIAIGEFIILN